MQKIIFAAALGLAGLANAPGQAMEIVARPASAPAVTLVSGGCGIGFHRGPYGGCRPNGGAVVVGAPVYGGVYGVHPAYGYHGGVYGVHGGYGYHGGYAVHRGYGYHGGVYRRY